MTIVVPRAGREPDQPRVQPGFTIRVSRGSGSGSTPLAAFDAALRAAGVADFNLVRLSSVIPPHVTVAIDPPGTGVARGRGDLLFCVYADAYAVEPGTQAWAGVVWSQHEDPAVGGLFAEHVGDSRAVVERDLQLTMQEMVLAREPGFGPQHTLLSSITCERRPVCAVVVASYRRVSWDQWHSA